MLGWGEDGIDTDPNGLRQPYWADIDWWWRVNGVATVSIVDLMRGHILCAA